MIDLVHIGLDLLAAGFAQVAQDVGGQVSTRVEAAAALHNRHAGVHLAVGFDLGHDRQRHVFDHHVAVEFLADGDPRG